MDPQLVRSVVIIIIIIIAAFVVAAGLWFIIEKRRRQRLRHRFGPEYERTVRELGSPRRAEAVLEARARRLSPKPTGLWVK
jgi:peptidoglycan/LPS O-acetylase OafA/YrhL